MERSAQQQGKAIAQLESTLAVRVRHYFSLPDTAAEERQSALGEVCSTLEYVLQNWLESLTVPLPRNCKGCSWWIDGVMPAYDMLPDAVQTTSTWELRIRGKAI